MNQKSEQALFPIAELNRYAFNTLKLFPRKPATAIQTSTEAKPEEVIWTQAVCAMIASVLSIVCGFVYYQLAVGPSLIEISGYGSVITLLKSPLTFATVAISTLCWNILLCVLLVAVIGIIQEYFEQKDMPFFSSALFKKLSIATIPMTLLAGASVIPMASCLGTIIAAKLFDNVLKSDYEGKIQLVARRTSAIVFTGSALMALQHSLTLLSLALPSIG